jgi:LL-H family phage holin
MENLLNQVVLALVSLLAAITLAVLAGARRRVLDWIDSRKNLAQRDLLHRLAEEAFALVEQTMAGSKSTEKLSAASNYLSRLLESKGITVGSDEIRAAIEKAVLQHNQRNAARP